MAKKRTGLQSEIAGIFSGVPVPKKGGPRSQPGGPSPKLDEPASKPGGPVITKPAAPQSEIPAPKAPAGGAGGVASGSSARGAGRWRDRAVLASLSP